MVKIIISCEHGGNQIPSAYDKIFVDQQALLNTHRGYDIGAINLAKYLAKYSHYYQASDISRLLVDLNRSLYHLQVFSEMTQTLSKDQKQALVKAYYFPYRSAIENKIKQFINDGYKVLHVSVHTFTPMLNGQTRNCDIGLLYNPKRTEEKTIAAAWKIQLLEVDSHLKIRFNYPYLGKADAFISYLRRRFKQNYIGLELEANQKFFIVDKNEAKRIITAIEKSFAALISVLQARLIYFTDLERYFLKLSQDNPDTNHIPASALLH